MSLESREKEEKRLYDDVHSIARTLDKLYRLAVKEDEEIQYILIIQWIGAKNQMATNDVTLNLTAPFGASHSVPVELENGNLFTFAQGSIQYAVQDLTVASFVQNPDGSADWTPLKAGSTGVAVTDTVTGAEAQGVLTVTGTANTFSMSIVWQTPVAGAAQVKK